MSQLISAMTETAVRPGILGNTEKIAIYLATNDGVPVKYVADHFQVSTRQIYRIILNLKEQMPDLINGVKCSEKILEGYMQKTDRERQTDDRNSSIPTLASSGRQTRVATIAASLSQLRKKNKGLQIQLAHLKRILQNKQEQETLNAEREAGTLDDVPGEPEEKNLLTEFMELSQKGKYARRYSEEMFRFGYVLLSYSPRAFHFVRQQIPLPSRSRICDKFQVLIDQTKRNLTDLNFTHRLLEAFVCTEPEGSRIKCTLGIDAFAFRLFLRAEVTQAHLKQELSLDQLRQIAPLLEDQSILADVFYEEEDDGEDDFDEPLDELTREKLEELFTPLSYCFIFVLQPLNSRIPCMTLHLLPHRSGMANDEILDVTEQLRVLCSQYNVDITYISIDGDCGWNAKFRETFKVMQSCRFTELGGYSLDVHNQCGKKDIPMAVTDLLHCLKCARGRYIDHPIIIYTKDLTTKTCYETACNLLSSAGRSLTDKSHLGRMRDFYPLDIFTIQNVIVLLRNKAFPDAFYFLAHALLSIVIRVPYFRMDFRMQLLSVAYDMFSYVYNDIIKQITRDKKWIKVPQRYRQDCEYITFAEASTLERILCTITAYSSAFLLYSDELRTDSLGTHIVEQRIGQSRRGGDCRWERILSLFTQGVIRSLFLEQDRVEPYSRGRLKTAGCRLTGDGDVFIESFDSSLMSRVMIHSLTAAGRTPEEFSGCLGQVISWLTELDSVLQERRNEVGKLWLPNPAANSSIIARLLKSSLEDFGI